jgi:hypothetical protein
MWWVFQSAFASQYLIQRPYSRDCFLNLRAQLPEAQVGNDGAVDEVFEYDSD